MILSNTSVENWFYLSWTYFGESIACIVVAYECIDTFTVLRMNGAE